MSDSNTLAVSRLMLEEIHRDLVELEGLFNEIARISAPEHPAWPVAERGRKLASSLGEYIEVALDG